MSRAGPSGGGDGCTDGLQERIATNTRRLREELDRRAQAEGAARESVAGLRHLYQSDAIGIITAELDGGISDANDAYLRMVGYSRDELRAGALRWDHLTPSEWWPLDARSVERLLSSGFIPTWEKEYFNRQGERVSVMLGGARLPDSTRACVGFVIDNRPRQRAEDALARLNQTLETRVHERTLSLQASEQKAEEAARALARSELQLRALAGHLQTVREDERAELSRELHDVLGQELTGIKMDVAWLARQLAPGKALRRQELLARLEDLLQQVDASIESSRRIATRLRPGLLDDLGLIAALEWQCREFQKRSGIAVRWSGPGVEVAIDPARASGVFRICQELLTNIARHAAARNAAVEVRVEGGSLTLEVRDDGRGITPQEIWGSGSLGLLGIRERALAAGGECLIEGRAGAGSCARVRVPLAGSAR
jgi:PAS domain S-box-containing protein